MAKNIKLTREEEIKIIIDRISDKVTSGGGSNYTYDVVSPKKLAEFLLDISKVLIQKDSGGDTAKNTGIAGSRLNN